MSQHAQALGTDYISVTSLGRTYRLQPLGPQLKADYEQWLKDRAFDSLRKQKSGPKAEAALHGAVAVGEYDWGQELWRDSIDNDAPTLEMLRLFVKHDYPDITHADLLAPLKAEKDAFIAAILNRLGVSPNTQTPDVAQAGDSTGLNKSAPS